MGRVKIPLKEFRGSRKKVPDGFDPIMECLTLCVIARNVACEKSSRRFNIWKRWKNYLCGSVPLKSDMLSDPSMNECEDFGVN